MAVVGILCSRAGVISVAVMVRVVSTVSFPAWSVSRLWHSVAVTRRSTVGTLCSSLICSPGLRSVSFAMALGKACRR